MGEGIWIEEHEVLISTRLWFPIVAQTESNGYLLDYNQNEKIIEGLIV